MTTTVSGSVPKRHALSTVWAFAAAASLLLTTTACRIEPGQVVLLPADYAVVVDGAGDLADFRALTRDSFTELPPSTARLVGQTYGVHFDGVGTTHALDGRTYRELAYHLADEDMRPVEPDFPAGDGREFLLVHVPSGQHLPEPERGYRSDGFFWDWIVEVDGERRKLSSDAHSPCLCTGSTIVLSVPIGADVTFGAIVEGRAQWLNLRTGKRM
jgi:hypothetical protein